MINRKPTLFFLAALLAMPIWSWTQTPQVTPPQGAPQAAAPATPALVGPAKIAFVNMTMAISTCEEGKKELATVQQYVEKKSAELQAMQKELDTLKNQLEVQGTKLTDEARADLADTIESKDTQLQRFQQDTQKDIDSKRQKIQNAIGSKIVTIIAKVAKEKGLGVVQFTDSNIYGYIDPSLVITDEVIKAYNQAYPVAAAAPVPVKK